MGLVDRKYDLMNRLRVALNLESMGLARAQIDALDPQAAQFALKYGTYAKAIEALQAEGDSVSEKGKE